MGTHVYCLKYVMVCTFAFCFQLLVEINGLGFTEKKKKRKRVTTGIPITFFSIGSHLSVREQYFKATRPSPHLPVVR